MKTNSTANLKRELMSLIAEKRNEIRKLESAMEALDGVSVSSGRRITRRRSKPSDTAIQSGKVSPGGRLMGFRDRIIDELKRSPNGITSKKLANRLFEPGLGIRKHIFARRIGQTMSNMEELIKSEGRPSIWTIRQH